MEHSEQNREVEVGIFETMFLKLFGIFFYSGRGMVKRFKIKLVPQNDSLEMDCEFRNGFCV